MEITGGMSPHPHRTEADLKPPRCRPWHAVLVTSTQVTGLTEWTPYFWQVRAVNGQGSTGADNGNRRWFITTPYLFGDDFESGDTSPWTTTVP